MNNNRQIRLNYITIVRVWRLFKDKVRRLNIFKQKLRFNRNSVNINLTSEN